MSPKRTILHSFSVLTGITIFEKIIAFVFQAIIAAFIGTNIITDGYFSSASLFNLIDSAFLSAITVVALNRYAYHVNNEGEKEGFDALSNLLSFYMPLMLLISVFVFSLAKPLSFLVAPGYGDEARSVVIRCIRVLSFIPLVSCVTSVCLAVLRQKKRFEITGLKSLSISVVGIISVIVFGRKKLNNADVLSIAYAISMIAFCLLAYVVSRKYGHIRICRLKINQELKNSLKMLLPLMVSYGVGRIALMVDSIIASTLQEGSVSALSFSHTLYMVVCAVFVTNLCTILLTDFNNMCAKKEFARVEKTIQRTVSTMTLILIPVTIVTVFNSDKIVKIVYERGQFSPNATALVGSVLLFYALNFIPVMIQGIYNQALYAFGDTLKPMWIAIFSIGLNLGTSIPLAFFIGLPGIAVGTVVSTFGSIILGRYVLREYLPRFKGCYNKKYLLKVSLAGCASIVSVFLVSYKLEGTIASFIASTILAFVVFLTILLILKEELTVSYFNLLLNRIKKK